MSDARLRELERRAAASNAIDDEAAYLLERVRAGALSRERLELAAVCGYAAACRATALAAIPPPAASRPRRWVDGWRQHSVGWRAFMTWLDAIERAGPAVGTLMRLECVSASLPVFEEAYPGDSTVRAALASIREWGACPCDLHAAAIVPACETVERRMDELRIADAVPGAVMHACKWIWPRGPAPRSRFLKDCLFAARVDPWAVMRVACTAGGNALWPSRV